VQFVQWKITYTDLSTRYVTTQIGQGEDEARAKAHVDGKEIADVERIGVCT
jgi:hypothetical protein